MALSEKIYHPFFHWSAYKDLYVVHTSNNESMQPWKLGLAESDKREHGDYYVNSEQGPRKLQYHL